MNRIYFNTLAHNIYRLKEAGEVIRVLRDSNISVMVLKGIVLVETLLETGILNQGQGNALTTKLEAAISNLNQSNENAAVNLLQAFINQIKALIKGGILSVGDGQPLIDSANEIINLITG